MSDYFGPRDLPEDHADWLDDVPLHGEALRALSDWSEEGLEDPHAWTNYDVLMDKRGENVTVSLTDESGFTYSFDIDVPLEQSDDWDWVWDIWDWIEDEYPDVELDAEYKED